jgi:hypothetical protein
MRKLIFQDLTPLVLSQDLTPLVLSLLSLTVLILIGCGTPGGLIGETPGERFRKAIATRERYCSTHKMAPGETTCDILKLKAPDPLATPEGRFAHSIKLPSPHDKPSEVHRAGMTSEEYFKALCEAEAGEFIFKTVENVEGIFQMRPRQKATDDMLQHLYAMEDPYGYFTDGNPEEPAYRYVRKDRYQFFENNRLAFILSPSLWKYRDSTYVATPPPNAKLQRFYGYDGNMRSMKKEFDATPKARYGYTWRGITRVNDLELGISGGELIVLDLQTQEVLGFQRNFARTGYIKNNATGVWWMTAQSCPQIVHQSNDGRVVKQESVTFISKVLKPVRSAN